VARPRPAACAALGESYGLRRATETVAVRGPRRSRHVSDSAPMLAGGGVRDDAPVSGAVRDRGRDGW